jgi:hypothetical protein
LVTADVKINTLQPEGSPEYEESTPSEWDNARKDDCCSRMTRKHLAASDASAMTVEIAESSEDVCKGSRDSIAQHGSTTSASIPAAMLSSCSAIASNA